MSSNMKYDASQFLGFSLIISCAWVIIGPAVKVLRQLSNIEKYRKLNVTDIFKLIF